MTMLGQLPTAPFGARPLSLAVVASHHAVRESPPGKPIHKWQVFRLICEAKSMLNVSDRALAVLEALLTFHPDTVLVSGSSDLTVFPSNRQLALRAHGMAQSTLRRHLAMLVEGGLILRRDSPNGKRYARKGRGGKIEQAFGFDLGPIVHRAEEMAALAEAVGADRRALDVARQRVTLCRRGIAKTIATGVEEGVVADWPAIHSLFAGIVARIPRRNDRVLLEVIADELTGLVAEVLTLLEQHVISPNPGATESRSERHIQSSNIETRVESEPGFREGQAARSDPGSESPKAAPASVPLGMVLEAYPDIIDYARGGISNWRDLTAATALVRSMLGISPSAWDDAREVMGAAQASVVIAAILQRGAAIKSPGGYLRSLTRRAAEGSFSLGPMLMASLSVRKHPSVKAGVNQRGRLP